jgi:phosphoserine aminotransferase
MTRAHNFSPGPSTLPESVLRKLSDELVEYRDTGVSVIEMSHRGTDYATIHHGALDALRRLTAAPDDIEILLLQGGATLQFAMAPMNLASDDAPAGYAVSGSWGKKALADAERLGRGYAAWTPPPEGPLRMPHPSEVELRPGSPYLHLTSNETIEGTRYPDFSGFDVPLVSDMSSDLLTRPIDWTRFDLVYAGAQKSLGPAGVTVVFVRSSVLDRGPGGLPTYLDYRFHAKADSLANTPAVFAIWAMSETLTWVESKGGLRAMADRAAKRSALVYDAVDRSGGFYRNPVDPAYRSHTNIVFRLPTEEQEQAFLAGASEEGLVNLKGHRSVGGIRVSVYNAMTTEGVEALVSYMDSFAQQA